MTADGAYTPRAAWSWCQGVAGARRCLCLTTCALIGMTWPLWIDTAAFPRIPFPRIWPRVPASLSTALAIAAVGSVFCATVERLSRFALPVSLGLMTILIAGDQARLQPWAYLYLLVGLALTVRPAAVSLRLARMVVIGMYLHSGVSKLDASFARELGPQFLETGMRLTGLWPRWGEVHFAPWEMLALPVFEIVAALLLTTKRTRVAGLVAITAMHVAVIAILSPLGLDHSAGVLAWNVGLMALNLSLLGNQAEPIAWRNVVRAAPLRAGVLIAAIILPCFERLGWWDTWPSFAVYASHNERVQILIDGSDVDTLPALIRQYLTPTFEEDSAILDLTRWSRAVRGAPAYPQIRTGIAIAAWLAERVRSPQAVRCVCVGRADWRTGARVKEVLVGPAAIASKAEGYWLNARSAEAGAHSRTRPIELHIKE